MEQLSLFDLDKVVEAIQTEPEIPVETTMSAPTVPAVAPKKAVAPAKPVLSKEELERFDTLESLYDLTQLMGTNQCLLNIGEGYYHRSGFYSVDIRGARRIDRIDSELKNSNNYSVVTINSRWENSKEKHPVIYFDKQGNCWSRACSVEYRGSSANMDRPYQWDIKFIWEGKWRLLTSLPVDKPIFLQTEAVREEIFKETMPYTYKYYKADNTPFSKELLMMCPQIELLEKAGYKFVGQLNYYPDTFESDAVTAFNRLIKFDRNPGKLQNIFKTTKEVCKILKEERNLLTWDRIRKLEKFSKSSPDEIQVIYDNHYNDRELANIQHILKQQYHDKHVFSFRSLVNYLNRVDQYEAIEAEEALQLISDYLGSCRLLDMEPKIDGDSLKREHDVAARLVREKRNEIEAKKMAEGCKKLQQYNYENDRYIIRGIKNYDDLLDEAKQQHNCVASYSSRIANGTSLIFVMRRKTVPNRSFVTIELSPDLSTVRQKYEAHNTPLRNKEASDFIDEWQKHCKDVRKGLVEPYILESDRDKTELPAIADTVNAKDTIAVAFVMTAAENEVEDDVDI